MSRVRENRMHGSMGGGWNRSVATVTGSGRPAETPGLCAGPTAVQRHRASSLPDLDLGVVATVIPRRGRDAV